MNPFSSSYDTLFRKRADWLARQQPESVMIRSGLHMVTSCDIGRWKARQVLVYVPRGNEDLKTVVSWDWSVGALEMGEDEFRAVAKARLHAAERMVESKFES